MPVMVREGEGALADLWGGPSPAAILVFVYGLQPVPNSRAEVLERVLARFSTPSPLERELLRLRVSVVLETVRCQGWRLLGAMTGGNPAAGAILPYVGLE